MFVAVRTDVHNYDGSVTYVLPYVCHTEDQIKAIISTDMDEWITESKSDNPSIEVEKYDFLIIIYSDNKRIRWEYRYEIIEVTEVK